MRFSIASILMKAPVIQISTSIIMIPRILAAVVSVLGPNVEVIAVCNVHHNASPILKNHSSCLVPPMIIPNPI
jgi:hypothetical protein